MSERRGDKAPLDGDLPAECRAPPSEKWRLSDARLVAHARDYGSLPQGQLTEAEIARIAVDAVAGADRPQVSGSEASPRP